MKPSQRTNCPGDARLADNLQSADADLDTIEFEPGRYIMMTIRSHDQFNTHTCGLNDRYRGIYNGRRVIFMNALDMETAVLRPGELVAT